jgi:DNA-binding transcriptional MerR regulator
MDETWTLAELVAEAASWIATLPPPKNGQVRAVPDDRTVRYYTALGLLDRPASMRGRTAIYGKRHLAQVIAIKRLQSAGHSLADIQGMWPTLDDLTLARLTGVTLPARAQATRQEFWKKAPASSVEATRPQTIDTPKAGARWGFEQSKLGTGSGVEAHKPAAGSGVEAHKPGAGSGVEAHKPAAGSGVEAHKPGAGSGVEAHTPAAGSGVEAHTSVAPVEVRIELAPGAVVSIALPEGASLTSADVHALRAAAAPFVAELAKRGLTAPSRGTLEEL